MVRLLRRCLEKDPARRLHDIADARIEIDDAGAAKQIGVETTRGRLPVWALAGLTVVAITAAGWGWLRPAGPASETDRTVRRLQVRLPEAESLADARSMPVALGQLSIAISPDGARLAYALERKGVTQLYLRGLDQLEGTPIPKTRGAFGPFFSADSRWIGFFANIGRRWTAHAVLGAGRWQRRA